MTPDQKPHIGKLLKEHRRSLRFPRISQEHLACQIDMSTVWVQKVEQGATTPSEEALFKAGRVMGLADPDILNMIEKSNYAQTATVLKGFRLTYETDKQLRDLAIKTGISERDLIKRFVEEGLDRANQT